MRKSWFEAPGAIQALTGLKVLAALLLIPVLVEIVIGVPNSLEDSGYVDAAGIVSALLIGTAVITMLVSVTVNAWLIHYLCQGRKWAWTTLLVLTALSFPVALLLFSTGGLFILFMTLAEAGVIGLLLTETIQTYVADSQDDEWISGKEPPEQLDWNGRSYGYR